MTWSIILLLISISTVKGSIDCGILIDMLNLNETNEQTTVTTLYPTPTPSTTANTRVPSTLPTQSSKANTRVPSTLPTLSTTANTRVPRTQSTVVNTTTIKTTVITELNPNVNKSVCELNSFAKLYSSLKTYHENELKKVQIRFEKLEVYVRNQIEEFQRKYYLLEATESPDLNPVSTGCECCSHPRNNNSSQDDNLLNKVEQIYQKISVMSNGNVQLLHKIEQVYEKLSNVTDEPEAVTIFGRQNCITNCSNKNRKIIDPIDPASTTPTIIDVRITDVNKRTHRKYLGCYQDRQDRRLLKEFMKHSKLNGVDACVDICLVENFVFAGIEGQWCRCDNKMPYRNIDDFKLKEARCNINCAGNSSQSCGGTGYTLSLYETGVEDFIDEELRPTPGPTAS